jgi:phage baseplate assembly protein gpV
MAQVSVTGATALTCTGPLTVNALAPVNVTAAATVAITAAAAVSLTAASVAITAASFALTGNLSVSGDVVAGTASAPISLLAHKHGGVSSGGSDTGPPTP